MAHKIDTMLAQYNRIKDKRDHYAQELDALRDRLARMEAHRFDDRVILVNVRATTVKAHKRRGFSYVRV